VTLKIEMDRFARQIIKNCLEKGETPVPFPEKLDAFKAVTVYYGILAKHKDDPPAADEGDTFDSFRKTLQHEENGSGGSTASLSASRRRDAGSIGGPAPRPIGGN
jgi:hypothetical protein